MNYRCGLFRSYVIVSVLWMATAATLILSSYASPWRHFPALQGAFLHPDMWMPDAATTTPGRIAIPPSMVSFDPPLEGKEQEISTQELLVKLREQDFWHQRCVFAAITAIGFPVLGYGLFFAALPWAHRGFREK